MNITDIMLERRSVRAFRDEPVPRQLLEQVLSEASWAPSALNMQPWEIHMVLGEERKRLSRRLLRAFRERGFGCAPGAAQPLADRFMERGRQCGEMITPLIQEMSSDFKTYVNEGSLNFYGAPAVALAFLDGGFPPERMADVGLFCGYLLLAAACHGLGTCPIGLVRAYEDDMKDVLNIPESKHLVLAVAMGMPDPDAAVNQLRTPRAALEEFVRWID